MSEEKTFSVADAHRKFAVDLFNRTWELIEKKDRSDEETELMIHAAHASCYHWSVVGTAKNRQAGEWQIARVYCLVKRPEAALHHARVCLQLTEANDIKDFDLAFAYEAMARASALNGNRADFAKYYALAEQAAAGIVKPGDRDYFLSDLKGGDWFGMR
jgi:hypothetical protein